jgi:hypothetical protein
MYKVIHVVSALEIEAGHIQVCIYALGWCTQGSLHNTTALLNNVGDRVQACLQIAAIVLYTLVVYMYMYMYMYMCMCIYRHAQ